MKTIATLAVILPSMAVYAQEMPLGKLVIEVPRAAVSAVKFRDAGKPKEFLTSALPAKGGNLNRLGQEMHQIADDIYEFPTVTSPAYFAYTHERLMQELRGKAAPTKLSQVSSEVLACQAKDASQDALIACVIAVVDGFKTTDKEN